MAVPLWNSVESDDKENSSSLKKSNIYPANSEWLDDHNLAMPLSQKQNSPCHVKDPPRTPAAKLALPDLIGLIDVRNEAEMISPEERVSWVPDGNGLQNIGSASNSVSRISKKRARSSSPVPTPRHKSEVFASKLETSETLKTPYTDPSFDLWDRFGLNTNTKSPRAPHIPAFANIMNTSSPQGPRDALTGLESGMRRALVRSSTCGTNWPKSSKRRKLMKTDDTWREGAASETSDCDASRSSRISSLLGKVTGGKVNKDKFASTPVPPSSSPVVDTERPPATGRSSPLKNQDGKVSTKNRKSGDSTNFEEDVEMATDAPPAHDTKSSDYGDFDDNEFDDAEVVSKAECDPQVEAKTLRKDDHRKHEETIHLANDDYEDEFGDMDDDVFADLEEVVAKYDINVPHSNGAESPKHMDDSWERKSSTLPNVAKDDSDDDYGEDLDDDDFDAARLLATQSVQFSASSQANQPIRKVRAIQRYLITNILESHYENHHGRLQIEKILLVRVDQKSTKKTIHLRGGWFDTPVTEGAFVHVIGDFQSRDRCIIDDIQNMLILHPDHLISSTVVADSFSCTRRAVLQDRVKATSSSNAPLVYGSILHEIFQAAMLANKWDTEWLDDFILTIATRHLEDLYTIKIQIPQAVEYLRSKMGELQAWAEVFVSSKPSVEAVVKTANGEPAVMCVNKLLDVEEHVWSPMYGLKGNIDATVQVTMQDGTAQRTLTVPFEVKTGKTANASHRAQTALYNLLLSDRYDLEIAFGILYYMETSETIRIPAIRHEVRHMIMQRNDLACFVRERHAQLPPMLKKENLCNGCYAKVPCFIYHKLADDGDGVSSGMKGKFDEVVKHLSSVHKEFFLKWDDLLTKEEKEGLKFRRELWTMLSSEREKLGRCFSNVILEEGSAFEEKESPKINRYRYTLIKESPPPGFSFMDSQIIVGEPIVISDELGHFALANGYVISVRRQKITVAVDRRLQNARIRSRNFDEVNNQVFSGIMDVAGEESSSEVSQKNVKDQPTVRYRLDKDEFSNGLATVRNNLVQIMADGPFGSRKIRSLVVDLQPPRYKDISTAYVLTDSEFINIDQRKAIDKVMSAQDYALVLGMPGTGKTTTIAHIIRALVSQGKSVLLTSYTHTAVDNILLKLVNDRIPILRLGQIAKVHPEVQAFVNLASEPKTSFEEIHRSWHDSPVVGTTCLGISHPIFNERTFDYCIVDEASQITLPVCLGPIRMAKTFILVGDHNQLPPLVQNEEARMGGLDISLFKLLSDAHPDSVVNLEHQYRMNEDVMTPSNLLIYNGRLKCGTPKVAQREITIPRIDGLIQQHHNSTKPSRTQQGLCLSPTRGKCWIRDLVDPSAKVLFVNTDPLLPASREEARGNRIVNPTEVRISVQLVESLISVGVPESSIGVMTHYRSQLSLLKEKLRKHNNVEMHTADRFQGRDKEVIILNLVRSNEAKSIGELLKDWRRINVAFTRAKTKLLVIGSRETLKGVGGEEMMSKFVSLMEEKAWIYDLPKHALDMHLFHDAATQMTASAASHLGATQLTPKKSVAATVGNKNVGKVYSDKENVRSPVKKLQLGDRALLSGNRNRILQDISNSIVG